MPNEFDADIAAEIQQEQSANAERDAKERDHRAMQVLRNRQLSLSMHLFATGPMWGVPVGFVNVDSYHPDPADALIAWEEKYAL